MASKIFEANEKLNERRKPLEAKDFAIGIHVLMKQNPSWTRFSSHILSEDQESILVDTADGRTFIIDVREV